MTTPTTDEELAKLREAVANDMADAVVPGLIARLDQAEQRVRELEKDKSDLLKLCILLYKEERKK